MDAPPADPSGASAAAEAAAEAVPAGKDAAKSTKADIADAIEDGSISSGGGIAPAVPAKTPERRPTAEPKPRTADSDEKLYAIAETNGGGLANWPSPGDETTATSNAAAAKWTFPGDGKPRPSTRLTASGKVACAYDGGDGGGGNDGTGGCPRQSQGRRLNFMCMSHFNSVTGGKMIPFDDDLVGKKKNKSHKANNGKAGKGGGKAAYDPERVKPADPDDVGGGEDGGNGSAGWTVLEVPRRKQGDHAKAADKYWFSPVRHYRFRSRVEVARFRKVLDELGKEGDEDEAWEIFRQNKGGSGGGRGGGGGRSGGDSKVGMVPDVGSSSFSEEETSSSEEDASDWVCDHCGATVPGRLSRCKCYRWKNGIHPMMKKKARRKREKAWAAGLNNQSMDATDTAADGAGGGEAVETLPGSTTTRSGRRSGRQRSLADEQAKAAEAPTRKRQRGAKSKGGAAAASKEDAIGKAAVSPVAGRARKRARSSAKTRRDARKREAAAEEKQKGKPDTDDFHVMMLRAVHEAPNAQAQTLAAAAFKAAGGDAWMAQRAVRTNANLTKLGLAPIPSVPPLPAKEKIVSDVLDGIISAVERRAAASLTTEDVTTNSVSSQELQSSSVGPSNAVDAAIGKNTMELKPTWPSAEPPVEDTHWDWNEAKQINYRQVLRISVKDPSAKELVTDARMSGIPVVLTDHVGWAGFALRWLRRNDAGSAIPACSTEEEEEKKTDGEMDVVDKQSMDGKELDLSDRSLYLDAEAMANDIGDQEVPVIKKSYDDTDPIAAKIPLGLFLRESWPSPTSKTKANQSLYLHQWQFPLNENACRKLCHKTQALPNSIFGEDLHKYWLDRVPNDCPLQYLFMGNEETMSKMHKDAGGLAITIAPIVGEKECVLVHRDDGNTCLYHLEASVDSDCIDLDAYPLLANARIWRTTIRPGEILLMPQGTYHQCRNVKSCLSYSRFHLDEVNLPAFLQSLFDGDATELEHDEVIWNAVEALMKKVDKVTDAGQDRIKKAVLEGREGPLSPAEMRVDEDIFKAVNALRSLRHVAREVARKLDLRETVKGIAASDEMPGPSSVSSKIDGGKEPWFAMVEDIDYCLHEFRFRYSKDVPPLSFSRPRGKKRFALPSTLMRSKRDDAANVTVYNGYQRVENNEDGSPILAFSTDLERGYILLSKAQSAMSDEERQALMEEVSRLSVGDTIMVKVKNKMCDAVVKEIRQRDTAVFMSYESYPALYDEYLPASLLREAIGGKSEVPLNDLKPGKIVIGLVGDKREEYRGVVKSVKCGVFIRAKLNFRAGIFVERWIDSELILGVGGIKRATRKRKLSSSDEDDSEEDGTGMEACENDDEEDTSKKKDVAKMKLSSSDEEDRTGTEACENDDGDANKEKDVANLLQTIERA